MKRFILVTVTVIAMLGVGSVVSAVAATYTVKADSKKKAYENAWWKFCKGGYCEGYQASISIQGNIGTAYINGNCRKIRFSGRKTGKSWRVSVSGNNRRC
ncbi:hypothetical protein MNBD_ALPHA03-125 [hydrothermal vent metagenome]|uniref:Uncharacterized protein n=1 Tax=hydrothermal vent metagenome TaxID=652676 RepID=A0A3B1ASA0_9ZZZZ